MLEDGTQFGKLSCQHATGVVVHNTFVTVFPLVSPANMITSAKAHSFMTPCYGPLVSPH